VNLCDTIALHKLSPMDVVSDDQGQEVNACTQCISRSHSRGLACMIETGTFSSVLSERQEERWRADVNILCRNVMQWERDFKVIY